MNSVTTGSLHPHLREEEVVVVETAVRLAVESVINVLFGLSSARTSEYQRVLGDRDRQIQRLEGRLRELEGEPRQPGCTCGVRQKTERSRLQVSAEAQAGHQSRYEASSSEPELGQQEQEKGASVALFERPSLCISFQSTEPSRPLSRSRRTLIQNRPFHSCESSRTPDVQNQPFRSSESLRTPDVAENGPTSPSSCAVKEEPCEIDQVFIQWEISQQEPEPQQQDGDTQDNKTPAGNQPQKQLESVVSAPCNECDSSSTMDEVQEHRDGRDIRSEAHTSPDVCPYPQRQHLRMKKKKNVPMSELSEEAQRLKRAAWRAASRRYYARKIARQQGSSAHAGVFSQVRDFRGSWVQRRTLMQELPNDCRMLQRDASATFRTPTIRHQQTEPTPCVRLHQDPDWPEDPLEPNGGSHGVSGGIMCS